MEIETVKHGTEVLAEGGIPFCEIAIALPSPIPEGKEAERVGRFYAAIAEGTRALAREVLLPHARESYERSNDPRRRFTHRPYRLMHTAILGSEGNGFAVTRTLALMHRGRTLFREEMHERITAEGYVLPERKSPRKNQRRPS